MKEKHIVIVGAGAVGAALAAQVVTCPANRVSFAADEARLQRLRERPLIVNGQPLEIGLMPLAKPPVPVDLIVLAVKALQLPDLLETLKPIIGEKTILLSMLNGIESEQQIAALYGWQRTLYGYVVRLDATREGHHIRALSPGRYVFGHATNETESEIVTATRNMLERAGVQCEVPRDMIRSQWWKFMINVGINPISALLGAPYRTFQQCSDARALLDQSMAEVVAVAQAEKIGLSHNDITEWHQVLDQLDPIGKTSMLQDMEAGRPTEVDIFCGVICKLGRKYQIPTPINDAVYRMIKALEFQQA